MIRKSKNNEDKPDFKEMWSEVNKNIQEKDAEQDIISRVPELRQLSTDIDKATNNCVNATLQCESVIRQYQRAEEKLDNAVDTISGKVDTINGHIDQVTNFMTNGWNRRNRCLPTNTNSRKFYGRSRVTGLLTL